MKIFNITQTLSEKDLTQIQNLNIDIEKIEEQYVRCSYGTMYIKLLRAATLNDGVKSYTNKDKSEFVSLYNDQIVNHVVENFIPASGAASRMFKFLLDFIKKFNSNTESINSFINKYNAYELKAFFIGIEKFSFYDEVIAECIHYLPNYNSLSQDQKLYTFVKVMLESSKFDYMNKPKGLIPFHKDLCALYTPITSHINEAISIGNKFPKIHFTVSKGFEKEFLDIVNQHNHSCFVSFSNQHSRTDSIAFDLENKFFRKSNNELLFRPGGHGALIENLNELNSDIIFIKNIDNVSFNYIEEINFNKKFLGGVLLKHQQTIFGILNEFDNVQTEDHVIEVLNYMEKELNIFIPDQIKINSTLTKVKHFIFNKLNRPIRVCGMVKNEGEPGGGPFWTKNTSGENSLQIVESAQINLKDVGQQLILSQSTHFNPVDIVCGVKGYKGDKFDLTQFVDPDTGFIVQKSAEGKYLKAYELPGLWNGGMADWISIFVEVPVETFNPVKTVNDLLKPAHRFKE
jgi:hypothetical protein